MYVIPKIIRFLNIKTNTISTTMYHTSDRDTLQGLCRSRRSKRFHHRLFHTASDEVTPTERTFTYDNVVQCDNNMCVCEIQVDKINVERERERERERAKKKTNAGSARLCL